MNTSSKYVACLGLLAIAGPLAVAQTPTLQQTRATQDANLKAYVTMIRKDLKKDKVTILTELMDLGPQEAARFWPVYNEYDKALTALADERIVFIRLFVENGAAISEDSATKIATGMMDIEARRVEMRKQYFQRVSTALSAVDAIRWLQIEAQIEKLVDLQILSSLPIVQ